MSESTAFPKFDDFQMQEIARLGERLTFQPGEVLIPTGQKNYPFFVVDEGEVEIVETDLDHEVVIATHGAKEFSGDVDMLTGRSALFTARSKSQTVAYSLPGNQLRKLLALCPAIGDMLLDAFQIRRQILSQLKFVGVRIVGRQRSPETTRLREFLYKNNAPHTFLDVDTDEGALFLHELDSSALELPVVRCNGKTLVQPTLQQVAVCLGINQQVDGKEFDLVIVGSGPSGLAAAVYAASEGMRVLVVDQVGPGGQAGSSSKIENFIGFPSGISGAQLANRGYLQALKFGATFVAPEKVVGIDSTETGLHKINLESGQTVFCKCLLASTGVTYRQLDMPGCTEFEGAGVYYAATSVESRACESGHAVIVGGGNSAGQAAMYLATHAEAVHLLIRGTELSRMSSYLSQRVLQHPKIQVHQQTEVEEVCGSDCVETVRVRNNQTDAITEIPCAGLFVFIGARPHTNWLPEDVLLDEQGFVLTGTSFFADDELQKQWPLSRVPCDLETTRPGVFAGGDVRSGTTKRCGFAVGDGSLAVTCVHRYLNELV